MRGKISALRVPRPIAGKCKFMFRPDNCLPECRDDGTFGFCARMAQRYGREPQHDDKPKDDTS